LSEKESKKGNSIDKVATGAGVLLPATIVGTVLLLVHDMLVNGVLTNHDYGAYTTCKRILQIGFLISFLGLENAVIRFVASAKERGNNDEAVGAWQKAQIWSLGVGGVLAALLALFSNPLAGLFPDTGSQDTIAYALRGLAVCLPLAAVRMMSTSASQGLLVMWPKAIALQVAWPMVNIVLVGALCIVGDMRLGGVILAYDVSMLVGALIGLWSLKRIEPVMFRQRQMPAIDSRALWTFAAPLWVYGIVNAAYAWVDHLLLAKMEGLEAAGIYGPVATIAPLFAIGLMALNGIFAPVISGLHASNQRDEMVRVYRVVARWSLTLALPVCLGAMLVPGAVIGIWPNGHPDAELPLQIIALSYIFPVAVGSVNYVLIMTGHQRQVLWAGIPGIFVNVGLALWLIPDHGVVGAAIANGAALIFISAVACVQLWVLLRIHPFSVGMYRPLLAAVPAFLSGGAAASTLPNSVSVFLVIALTGLSFALVYACVLWLLGVPSEDREMWRRFRKR